MKTWKNSLSFKSFDPDVGLQEMQERDRQIAEDEKRQMYEAREKAFRGSGIPEDAVNCTFPTYTAETDAQKRALTNVWDFTKRVTSGVYTTLILYGPPGTGKTHLAVSSMALSVHKVKKIFEGEFFEYYSVKYTRSDSLTNRFRNTASFKSSESYDDVLRAMTAPDILVIDEVGRDPLLGAAETNALFSVIDKRKSLKRSTVIISNCSWNELNVKLGSATMSRLLQTAVVCDMSGIGDYRLNHRG